MSLIKTTQGQTIDLNYAEDVVKHLKTQRMRRGRREVPYKISSSKLRTLLEPVNNLFTQVHHGASAQLSDEIIEELQYIKVRFMYESGREEAVKKFLDQSYLVRMLDQVVENGDKRSFIYFCRYFEALIAYAKYHRMEER